MADSAGPHRLYIQWLDGYILGSPAAYTVSVREFNVLPELQVSKPRCVDLNCQFSYIQVSHLYEGVGQAFTLTLDGMGRYSLGLDH